MVRYVELPNGDIYDRLSIRTIPFNSDPVIDLHYMEYLNWVADGNTPDLGFSQEEVDEIARLLEVSNIKANLAEVMAWQFRMILTIWEVGKSKGLWDSTDIDDAELKAKVSDWKTKLLRLKELGE